MCYGRRPFYRYVNFKIERVACEVEESCTIDDESCIVNSLITGSSFVGKGSLVEHCRLTDGAKIEK